MELKHIEVGKVIKDSLIWISIFLTYLAVGINNKETNLLIPFFFTLIQFLTYTINRFVYIPRYYESKRNIFYIVNIVTIIVLVLMMIKLGAMVLDPPKNELKRIPPDFDMFFFLFQVLLCVIALWVALNQHLSEKKKIHENEIEKLKNKNLENNLQFLKMQINPHFLFNALNNIYTMSYIGDKSTPETINKLSDMLKYVLYDCESDFIPIQKEIEYIHNYIDFQQIKTENHQNINFTYNLENENFFIAPMLMIPFIENAFKHSKIDRYVNHCVNITITQSGGSIEFHITNDYKELISPISNSKHYNGIGIKNVVNRLNLLYPDSYTLDITNDNHQYKVKLTIVSNGSKQQI